MGKQHILQILFLNIFVNNCIYKYDVRHLYIVLQFVSMRRTYAYTFWFSQKKINSKINDLTYIDIVCHCLLVYYSDSNLDSNL